MPDLVASANRPLFAEQRREDHERHLRLRQGQAVRTLGGAECDILNGC